MHRIKLNDRMTFPEELDMSPFIDVEDEVTEAALASVDFIHSQFLDSGAVLGLFIIPGMLFQASHRLLLLFSFGALRNHLVASMGLLCY